MVAATQTTQKNRRLKRGRASPLLETPAPLAVRRIIGALLGDLRRARRRLDAERDDDALHDFRVALRRLRSTLRIYRSVLKRGAAPRKLRRALKRLARASGGARDAEVGLAWLQNRRNCVRGAERAACDRLIADWKARRDAGYKETGRALNEQFGALDRRLREASGAFAREPRRDALAATVVQLLPTRISAVATELQRIASVADAEAIHAARVEVKRLRYLLEPLAAELPGGAALVKPLKRFQDEFGALCDRQVLSDELIAAATRYGGERSARELQAILDGGDRGAAAEDDVRPGLLLLAARLTAERRRRFATIECRYLGESTDALLAPYRALAHELAREPRPRKPKGRRAGGKGRAVVSARPLPQLGTGTGGAAAGRAAST